MDAVKCLAGQFSEFLSPDRQVQAVANHLARKYGRLLNDESIRGYGD
jgi:hypothetical protein